MEALKQRKDRMISREGGFWKRRVDPERETHYHTVCGRVPPLSGTLFTISTHGAPRCHLHFQFVFTPPGALETTGPAQWKHYLLPSAVAATGRGQRPLHQRLLPPRYAGGGLGGASGRGYPGVVRRPLP